MPKRTIIDQRSIGSLARDGRGLILRPCPEAARVESLLYHALASDTDILENSLHVASLQMLAGVLLHVVYYLIAMFRKWHTDE